MKNLENYGVVSLKEEELIEIDGGIFGIDDAVVLAVLIVMGVSLLAGAIYVRCT